MPIQSGFVARCVLVLGGVFLPAAAGAQQTTILVGSVRDSAGRGVGGVEVRIESNGLVARTTEAGGFRISSVPVGLQTVDVRRLGFAPVSTEVILRAGRIDSLVMSLTAVAAHLPGVLVEDEAMSRSKRLLAGFWSRKESGFGHFLTRDQIEARNATNFADLFRQVPSVNVLMLNGRPTIRFNRSVGVRDCPPQYWVDGMRIEQGTPDEFSPEDVEAIEMYAGPATLPAQFAPRPYTYTCGAIVIWMRLPGS